MDESRSASSSLQAARRAEFKSPPANRFASQEDRRARALQEQKRQRALRVNAARNIDLLGSLTLNAAGGEDDDEDEETEIVQEPLSAFASMLQPQPSSSSSGAGPSSTLEARPSSPTNNRKGKGRRGGKSKKDELPSHTHPGSSKKSKPPQARFANVPMFAELLELREDDTDVWDISPEVAMDFAAAPGQAVEHLEHRRRLLPQDLETGWVALAPIPAGKRCLAVSHQHHGMFSKYEVTNTHLHSRLKGTRLLKFPSSLPPDSILDCILDANWQENGIIHVLDLIRWRGTDFLDCEAEFRFWWRDARVSELVALPPFRRRRRKSPNGPLLFDHPISFIPVPHCNPPIPLQTFLENVIPQARMVREISVPVFKVEPQVPGANTNASGDVMDVEGPEMEVDPGQTQTQTDVFGNSISEIENAVSMGLDRVGGEPEMTTLSARIETDGLLLYVSEASYQPGETPLSCWIPAHPLDRADAPSMLDLFEKLIIRQLQLGPPPT